MMRTTLSMTLAIAIGASVANASDLNLRIESGGSSMVTAAPGDTVPYVVIGRLSDTLNEGLALFGLNLEYTGGPMPPTNEPTDLTMMTFTRPGGITNPGSPTDATMCPPACGFGGTMIGDALVQVGGGANTIINTIDNAPFPIGTALALIARDADQVLVTGSVVVPMTPGGGPYVVSIPVASVFANVIKAGETGIPFWAAEAAGVGTIMNLTIMGDVFVPLTSAEPACNGSLGRSANNVFRLTFGGQITAPVGSEVMIQELSAAGGTGTNMAANFDFVVEGAGNNILKITEVTPALTHGTWIGITRGTWTGGAADFKVDYQIMVGDANGDGRVLFSDLGLINTDVPNLNAADNSRLDINGDGRVLFSDLGVANVNIPSLGSAKPAGHVCNP